MATLLQEAREHREPTKVKEAEEIARDSMGVAYTGRLPTCSSRYPESSHSRGSAGFDTVRIFLVVRPLRILTSVSDHFRFQGIHPRYGYVS